MRLRQLLGLSPERPLLAAYGTEIIRLEGNATGAITLLDGVRKFASCLPGNACVPQPHRQKDAIVQA